MKMKMNSKRATLYAADRERFKAALIDAFGFTNIDAILNDLQGRFIVTLSYGSVLAWDQHDRRYGLYESDADGLVLVEIGSAGAEILRDSKDMLNPQDYLRGFLDID